MTPALSADGVVTPLESVIFAVAVTLPVTGGNTFKPSSAGVTVSSVAPTGLSTV